MIIGIKKYLLVIFIGLSPYLLFSQMMADTIKIDEIIVLYEKDISQAGITNYSIDKDIKGQSTHSVLSDLLKSTGMVYVRDYGSGNLATISIRGAGASHTQVTWNGMNINSPLTGQVDFSIIPNDFIDNISIYPGNGAVQQQTGAIGGNISLSSSHIMKPGFHLKLAQEIASFNTYSSFFQTESKYKNWYFISRGSVKTSRNNFPYLNSATLPTEKAIQENATTKNLNFLQEIYYNFNKNNILTFNIWNSNNNRNIPSLMSHEGVDHIENQIDNRTMASLKWSIQNTKSKLRLQSGYIYDKIYYVLSHDNSVGLISANESNGISHSFLNNLNYETLINKSTKVEISIDLNHHSAGFENLITKTSFQKNRNEFSLYSGIHKRFTKRLITYLLLRNSIYNETLSPISPSIGFEFLLLPDYNMYLNGSLGSNYRFPTLNDMYFIPGGNPDLNPEKSNSAEIGMVFNKEILNNNVKFIINSFSTIINDWILWKPTQFAYWQPENIQKVKSQGIESSIHISRNYNKLTYRIIANYSLTHTTNEADLNSEVSIKGHQLIYIPVNKGNILSSIKIKNSTINYNMQYTGLRYTDYGPDIEYNSLPSFWVHDISFDQSFKSNKNNFNISFNIRNIFNIEYQSIRYRATPGINFSLKLSYEL